MKKLFILIPLLVMLLQCCANNINNRTAEDIARAIGDKIIRETAFQFDDVSLKPVLDLQILDFKHQYDSDGKGIFYSMSNLSVDRDTTLLFGFNYTGGIKIFVNGKMIFEGINRERSKIKEVAYNMFVWNEKKSIRLNAGINKVMIKMVPVDDKPVLFMREIAETSETPLSGSFAIDGYENNESESDWVSVGAFPPTTSVKESLVKSYPPEEALKDKYEYMGKSYQWRLPNVIMLKELTIPETNSYKRESYIEWHYANGTMLTGLLTTSETLNDQKYSDFVAEVCSMNVANKEMLKKQFEDYYAIRGTNNRMFRKTMLDDTGAPVLPYLQTYMNTKDESLKPTIDEMVDYVVNGQVRLDDRSFCRPEPVAMTIWCDDLFMSVPLLVRMGKLTGDTKYYDDAARQIVNFYGYLFDEEAGVCKHGWFQPTNEKSKVYWGRANGWIVWATSEALLYLPTNHPAYKEILKLFKAHIDGLIKYQDKSGMWHQVLDKPESFKETSCTAMFITGIVRGIMSGWLDESYRENALRAWNEMKTKITEDGTVKDICRGTGIGYDEEFYFTRKCFDNDPRGLGSVLTAACEINKLTGK